MKQKLYLLFCLLQISLMSFGQTLDQSNAAFVGGVLYQIDQSQNVGQSFTAGISGQLAQVNIKLGATDIIFSAGNFRLSVISGAGFDGSVVGSQDFTMATNPGNGEYVINIENAINVVSGNIYTLKFEGLTGIVALLVPNASYSGGTFYYNDGNTITNPSWDDLWFKTFVSPSTPATHLNFDGINDRIELANESNFDFINTFSIEAWVQVSSFTVDWQTIISKGAEGPRIHRFGNSNFIAFGTGHETTSFQMFLLMTAIGITLLLLVQMD